MNGPVGRDVLAPDAAEAEVQVAERLQHPTGQPVDERVDAAPARTMEKAPRDPCLGYAPLVGAVTVRRCRSIAHGQHAEPSPESSPPGRGRPRRSSTCAPSGWTTPTRRCSGKAVTRGPAWPAVGFALHLLNGAAFGAAYTNIAPRLPLPSWARGPALAMIEHLTTWPVTVAVDRVHPARNEMPDLWGNGRAFAQATWRHLVFGIVLGELERRFNGARRHRRAALRAGRLLQRPRRHRARRGRVRDLDGSPSARGTLAWTVPE